jgi:hypothetical protein
LQQLFNFGDEPVWAFLDGDDLVRTIAFGGKNPVLGLHQDLLLRIGFLDLFAKLETGVCEVANIHNHQMVFVFRQPEASLVQRTSVINTVPLHAQHKPAEVLHGGITIDKKDADSVPDSRHVE